MKILIDTNILIQLLDNKDRLDFPSLKTDSISHIKERANKFIDYVDDNKIVVCISVVVLAEFLQGIEQQEQKKYLDKIKATSCFEILSFDEIAAIELSKLPLPKELKNNKSLQATAALLKMDRQIISIALANDVSEIWTHDKVMANIIPRCNGNIKVKSFDDIDLSGSIPDLFQEEK